MSAEDLFLAKLFAVATASEHTARLARPLRGTYPPCFDSLEKYQSWLEAGDRAGIGPPMTRTDFRVEPNYCQDCLPRYHQRMCADGRCLFPETRFRVQGTTEECEIVGRSGKIDGPEEEEAEESS